MRKQKVVLIIIIVFIVFFSIYFIENQSFEKNIEYRNGSLLINDSSTPNSVVFEWSRLYGEDVDDHGSGVNIDSNNNVIVVGSTENSTDDILILKYNATGCLIWNRTWDTGGYEYGRDVVVDFYDNIYVSGLATYSNTIYIIKYNSDGSQLWNISHVSSGYSADLAIDLTNNIYCTGTVNSGAGDNDILTIKYNENGVEQWSTTWGSSSHESSNAICVDNYNNIIYVTGRTANYDIFTLKYNTLGNLLWEKSWGGAYLEEPHGIDTDSTGSIFITGESWSDYPGIHTFLLKYDSFGNKLWNISYGTFISEPINNEGKGIFIDGENIYLSVNYGNDIHLLKYNPEGTLGFKRTWKGSNYWSTASDIAGDLNHNIYVVGTTLITPSPHDEDLSLTKYGYDYDGDGLSDWQEENLYSTDPYDPDSDDDFLNDKEELTGINNSAYGYQPTDPNNSDTDNDELNDFQEIFGTLNSNYGYQPTDPNNNDTDSDGLSDGAEINDFYTNPLASDTDSDGLSDGAEINDFYTNPLASDTDSDGLSDGAEINDYNTNPLDADTDSDLIPDKWEIDNLLDPLINDSAQDPDNDLLSNLQEYQENTDPNNSDTDGDGWKDGEEVLTYNTDPLDPEDYPRENGSSSISGYNIIFILLCILSILSLIFKKVKYYPPK